jgi:leucyl aminopeptidase
VLQGCGLTDGLPWAHLDIAGPAFTEEGDAFYTARGGTGAPVRVRYLQSRAGCWRREGVAAA